MKHKRIIVPVTAFVFAFGLVVPTFAMAESNAPVETPKVLSRENVENRVKRVEERLDRASERASERAQTAQERVMNRQAELKERFEKRKAQVKERLQGQRLERCESRQLTINQLIDKSAENGQRHLEKLQKYEKILVDFAEKQSLDTAEISTAKASVDASESDAQSTLATLAEQNFVCGEVDSSKPNGLIRDVNHERVKALKVYRDDVKELLLVIKRAFTDKEAA